MDREQALSAMIAALFEDGDTPLVRQGMPQQTWEMLSIVADAVAALARSESAPVADRDRVVERMKRIVAEYPGRAVSYSEIVDLLFADGTIRSEAERPACHHAWEELNPGDWLCKECGAEADLRNSPDWTPEARSEAEVKAEALREAAVKMPGSARFDDSYVCREWLRERADELEGRGDKS